MTALAIVLMILVIVGLLVALIRATQRFSDYRVAHPHTDAALKAAKSQAVTGSRASLTGKAAEQLAFWLPEFCAEFNPRDARFLGSPVDLVVFDGHHQDEVERIVFVEVKTKNARLNPAERSLKRAVEARRVEWRLLPVPEAMTSEDAVDATPPPP